MKFRHLLMPTLMAAALLAQSPAMAQKKAVHAKKKMAAAAKTTAPEKVTSVEGITEYRLANGLRVLLFPDPSKPTITVNMTYLVGSRMEGYGETGMAHLLEHMEFKGSKNHPHIPDELTAHGASPNGSTSYDRTNYFETFSATDENLNWALSLESDRMVNSFIAEKDLKSEFSVVRNEFESGENNPSNILLERVLATAYIWHNYGKATIGSKEDIERVPIKSLQAFYHKYYQPDNAVLMVAGKIDEAKTLELVNKYFSPIPRPGRVIDPTYTVEPPQDGERNVVLRRTGDLRSVSCAYHICSGSHPDFAAFDVLSEVLTNEPNGRLYQAMVKTGKASNVWSWDAGLKDPGFLYINADVLKEKSAEDAQDTMFQVLSDLKKIPVTQDEVDKAKSKLMKNFEEMYRNSEYIGLTMSEYIAQGDWRLAFIYRDNLKKVTADDVNRIIKTYLLNSNRTTGIFIPTADPKRVQVPPSPNIDSLTDNYKGQKALAQAEAFDPSPDNIQKRTETGSIAGGAKYALLTKTTRGATVQANITLRVGNQQSLQNKATIAALTASMLRRGTGDKTMSQLNEALDKLSSSVNIYGNGQAITISISSTKPNLSQTLDLVNDMLHHPAFSADELKTLKEENISNLEQERSEPQSIAFREMSRITTPRAKGDINYVMTVDEEIAANKAVTLDQIKDFYKDYYNSGHATVAFVGDFDATMVKGKLDKILANWTSPKSYTHVPEPYDDVAGQSKEIITPDKKNAMYVVGENLKIRDDNAAYPALLMGNFIFGGGFLNSRLATRIRQKEGLSYGIGSFVQANALDESGGFTAYAIYNPANKEKLDAAFKDETAKMLKDGFTEEELKAAKSGYLQYRQNARADDQQLAYALNSNLFLNRTMAWNKSIDEKLENLTVSDVNAAMRKYINPDKMIYVKAGDFK